MVQVGAQAREDISIKVGGKTLTKPKGEYLRAINSRRYTQEEFTLMAEE